MTVYCEPHAHRHRVARFEADPRVVVAVCGERVALVGLRKNRPAVYDPLPGGLLAVSDSRMSDRSSRKLRDPIVVALGLALREIAERRAEERAARRATMAAVSGAKRDGGRAA